MKKSFLVTLTFLSLSGLAIAADNHSKDPQNALVIRLPAKLANNLTIVNQCNNATLMQSSNYQESKSAHSYSYRYSAEMSSALVSDGAQTAQKDKDHCTVILRFNAPCQSKDAKDCTKTIDYDPANAKSK
jgi:hypothetical protein